MQMQCKQCRCDLTWLRANRCPECGERFDPLLTETYRPAQRVSLRAFVPWRFVFVCFALLAAGLLYDEVTTSSAADEHLRGRPNGVSIVQTVRNQLALYANQHDGTYPSIDQLNNGWGVMLTKTDLRGHAARAGELSYGPYLQKQPVNPFTYSSSVAAVGQSTPRDGWEYDPQTGMLWLVIPTREQFDLLRADSEHAVVAARP